MVIDSRFFWNLELGRVYELDSWFPNDLELKCWLIRLVLAKIRIFKSGKNLFFRDFGRNFNLVKLMKYGFIFAPIWSFPCGLQLSFLTWVKKSKKSGPKMAINKHKRAEKTGKKKGKKKNSAEEDEQYRGTVHARVWKKWGAFRAPRESIPGLTPASPNLNR